jgi:hypothetical protein
VTEYELLRARAIGADCTASGLAVSLVLREGLRSWMDASSKCVGPLLVAAPVEMPAPHAIAPELIATLADIALSHLEVRA